MQFQYNKSYYYFDKSKKSKTINLLVNSILTKCFGNYSKKMNGHNQFNNFFCSHHFIFSYAEASFTSRSF